jgi:hypothetical protein
MAEVHGAASARPLADALPASANNVDLPSVAELGPEDTLSLSEERLAYLLQGLRDYGIPLADNDLTIGLSTPTGAQSEPAPVTPLADGLRHVHRTILAELTVRDGTSASEYQLGAALQQMCTKVQPDSQAATFTDLFSPDRLTRLNSWLTATGTGTSPTATATVRRSLENWRVWADANAPDLQAHWDDRSKAVDAALRRQGEVWRALLMHEADPTAEPGLSAWMQAGDAMLRTTRSIAGHLLRQWWLWLILLVILGATGSLLYLAIAHTSRVSAFWTSLVTVGGGLGVTGATVYSAAQGAMSGIEHSASEAAEVEARAWSSTTLPALTPTRTARRQMRRHGVGMPVLSQHLQFQPPLPGPGTPTGGGPAA